MPLDLVSVPVLTWGLPLIGDDGAAAAARARTGAGLPLHLSVLALRAQPPRIVTGTPVLVVENPRLVEVAAQRILPAAVLCTHGNPTSAPTEAVAALRVAGAQLRYHGDFDAPAWPWPHAPTPLAAHRSRCRSGTTATPWPRPG
jgi:hypothetical protein